jgi:hypothetical protein
VSAPSGGAGIGLSLPTTSNGSINGCLFVGNVTTASGGALGGSAGSLFIGNSRFTGNAAGSGGAIDVTASSLIINDSTIDNNRASTGAGGLLLDVTSNGSALNNDTIAFNATGGFGGGLELIAGTGTLALNNDTIDGNTAGAGDLGGGVFQDVNDTVDVTATIIADNTAGSAPADYSYGEGTLNDDGGNLLGNANSDGGKFGASTIIGDPKLGPLEDNGGNRAGAPSTSQVIPTQALLPGSPAILAGVASVIEDERGFNRPTKPSIGAYEPQYASNASANQVFAENLYDVLLNRPGDPTGLTAAVNFLNNGGSPTALTEVFESTPEHLVDEAAQLVRRYLNRAPSSAQTGTILGFLESGHTPEQAAAIFLGSAEFAQDYGGNDDVILEAMYQSALGRAASQEEVDGWDQALATSSAAAVAGAFLSSQEYLDDLAVDDFEAFLGVDPSGSQVAAFRGAARMGLPRTTLAAIALAASFAERT